MVAGCGHIEAKISGSMGSFGMLEMLPNTMSRTATADTTRQNSSRLHQINCAELPFGCGRNDRLDGGPEADHPDLKRWIRRTA